MAQQLINIGEAVNDKRGDPLRTAFDKVNQNFTELFTTDTNSNYHLGDDTQFIDIDPESGLVQIQSGFDTSMPVYVKGGNCSDGGIGGDVYIEAGGAALPNLGTTGNIEMAANNISIDSLGNIWTFQSGDGSQPSLTFPEWEGEQLGIQGSEIVAIQGVAVLGSVDREVVLSTGLSGSRKDWTFDNTGVVTLPARFPIQFTAVFDSAHYVDGVSEFTGDGTFQVNVELQGQGTVFSWVCDDPIYDGMHGYQGGEVFVFTGEDHGIQSYPVQITIQSVNESNGNYTLDLAFTVAPSLSDLAKIKSTDELIIRSGNKAWMFDSQGNLYLPASGDIKDSNGQTVLGGGSSFTVFDNPIRYATVTELQFGNNLTVTEQGAEGSGVLLIDATGGGANTGNVQFDGGGMFVPVDDNMSLSNSTSDLDMNYITLGPKTLDIYAYNNTSNNGAQISFDNSSAHALAQITVTDNSINQYWTFNADGSMAFPSDLKVSFDQDGTSILSRENVVDNGLGFDSFYTNIKLTPDFTIIETVNDPDGPNNERIGRITTSDTSVLLEAIQRDVSGETIGSISLTGAGVTVSAGDGILQSQLQFGGDGLVVNSYGVITAGDDVYLKAIQNTALNLSAGELLESLENDYINNEALFQITVQEDEAMISPDTRPWHGLNSYEAYQLIIANMPWTGGGLPPPSNIVPIAKTASDSYYAWQAALGVAKVNVNVGTKTWTFDGTGVLQLPYGAVINDSYGTNIRQIPELRMSGGRHVTMSGTGAGVGFFFEEGAYAGEIVADLTNGFGLLDHSGLGISLESYGHKWKFGNHGVFSLSETLGAIYANTTTGQVVIADSLSNEGVPTMPSTAIYIGGENAFVISRGNGTNNPGWTFGDDGKLKTPGEIWTKAGDGIQGLTFSPNGTDSSAYIKVDGGQNAVFQTNGNFYVRQGVSDRLSISSSNTTLTATNNVRFGAGGSSKVWILDTSGNITFPDSTVQTTAYQTTTAPTTSKGVSGNKAGMVAFDNSAFYYCKQDYTDGVADIWVKQEWTTFSW